MKELKRKVIATFITLLLAFTLTVGTTYAWWDTLTQTKEEVINIGEGLTLELDVIATAPVGKVLIPQSATEKTNDVKSIVLTYNVRLDQESTVDLNLSVVAQDIKIAGSEDHANLVNISIVLGEPTINAADVLVTVTVTIEEPATEAVYEAIKNQAITFTLVFTATE